jgi:hypothetical protein
MISDEVEASEVEGLEGREDGGLPQPNAQGRGKLQRAKADHIAQAHEVRDARDGGHLIAGMMDAPCPPHGWHQMVVGASMSTVRLSRPIPGASLGHSVVMGARRSYHYDIASCPLARMGR